MNPFTFTVSLLVSFSVSFPVSFMSHHHFHSKHPLSIHKHTEELREKKKRGKLLFCEVDTFGDFRKLIILWTWRTTTEIFPRVNFNKPTYDYKKGPNTWNLRITKLCLLKIGQRKRYESAWNQALSCSSSWTPSMWCLTKAGAQNITEEN